MALSDAALIVARCQKVSLKLATEAITTEMKTLAGQGFVARVCAVLQGRTRELPELERILSSHPLLHTAEGIFYRQVLISASEPTGMQVLQVPERELEVRLAAALHLPADRILPRLTALGRGLGSPWTADQKLAAGAAWLALVLQP